MQSRKDVGERLLQGKGNRHAADTGSSEDDEYGGSYDKSTVGKQVRLVVTIEYGIE